MKKVLKIIGGVIGFLVALAILGSCMGGGDSSSNSAKKESKPKTYVEVSVGTLIDAAKANAAKAKQDYNGKDIKIVEGIVRNIDSDSKYFTVADPNNKFEMMSVHVKPRNNEQKKDFVKLEKGKQIVVYGTVDEVGDIMGFTVKLDKFEQ